MTHAPHSDANGQADAMGQADTRHDAPDAALSDLPAVPAVSAMPERSGRHGRPRRSSHRARRHAEAHHGSDIRDHEPGRPDTPGSPPLMVETSDGLAALLDRLRAAGSFAFDTEFIGEASYHPFLCLVQVATDQDVTLIDPLHGLDLTPFWALLAEDGVRKVVHAGEQDLEPVVRHLGRPATNVLDTQIAAGFAGLTYPVSLSKLVRHVLGVDLAKGVTFTAWDARPLTRQQLRYAADDVRYLLRVAEHLEQRVARFGHTESVRSACDERCAPAYHLPDPVADARRVRGSNGLSGRETAVLRQLVAWRTVAAEADDLPPRAFLKDEVLIALSRSPVTSLERLGTVRHLPRPMVSIHGRAIVDATAAGLTDAVEIAPDRTPEPSAAERFEADAVASVAGAIAAGRGIDLALVANRAELGELTRRVVAGEPTDDLPIASGWRAASVGGALLDVLHGRSSVTVRREDGRFRAEAAGISR